LAFQLTTARQLERHRCTRIGKFPKSDSVTGAPLTNAPPPTPSTSCPFLGIRKKESLFGAWNFGLERQIDANTVVTANYVGSQTHRLNVGGLYNTALILDQPKS